MPALQIKDCPLDTYEQLKIVAAEENRSISQQMLTILQQFLADKKAVHTHGQPDELRYCSYEDRSDDGTDYAAKHRRAIERLRELPSVGLPDGYTSAADLVRDAREQRW